MCTTRIAPASEGRLSLLEWNAGLPEPMPVCIACNMPFQALDGDVFDARLCTTCGWIRLEERALALVFARGRKARKEALRRLLALAK